jgi:hypothetical protein
VQSLLAQTADLERLTRWTSASRPTCSPPGPLRRGRSTASFSGSESILLAVIGSVVGVLAGAAATAVYASSKS